MTEINSFFSVLAGFILLITYIPYGVDISRGRVVPARSARMMFAMLLSIALLQQCSLGSSWTLFITIGELVGSFAILGLAFKYGVGGMRRVDIACYFLLSVSLVLWWVTNNAFIALHTTILADLVAFTPTLIKTWRNPQSETPLFFLVGTLAPLLTTVGLNEYNYAILAFPLYLAFANALEIVLIYRHRIILMVQTFRTN